MKYEVKVSRILNDTRTVVLNLNLETQSRTGVDTLLTSPAEIGSIIRQNVIDDLYKVIKEAEAVLNSRA